MAMFNPPDPNPAHGDPGHRWHGYPEALPVDPPPDEEAPVDTGPWLEAPLPPEDQKRPGPPVPPVVVIEPVEKPPVILPPIPDMTPDTIVPPVYEDPIPVALPLPPVGKMPPTRPPPTIVMAAGAGGLGTFMVYVGRRLVLTMAAALGTQLGKNAGAMLVGAVNKQLFRGTAIRFHTGQSFGLEPSSGARATAVSYEQAWRMVPQEFSYWEA